MTYLVLVVALLILLKFIESARGKGKPYPYTKREALFTPAERSFLSVLEQSVGAEYRIMGKVRLGDIVAVEKRLAGDKSRTAGNKINQKHVDFVLCDPQTLAIVLVVELDDRSHERPDRRDRDIFVDGALAAADIPIAHIPAQRHYSMSDVRRRISEALSTR